MSLDNVQARHEIRVDGGSLVLQIGKNDIGRWVIDLRYTKDGKVEGLYFEKEIDYADPKGFSTDVSKLIALHIPRINAALANRFSNVSNPSPTLPDNIKKFVEAVKGGKLIATGGTVQFQLA